MLDRITVLHFSPTGGTRRAALLLAGQIASQVEEIDLTLPQSPEKSFAAQDVEIGRAHV